MLAPQRHFASALFIAGACAAPGLTPQPADSHTATSAVARDTDLDFRTAWDEHEANLRDNYAYLERDDFSVDDQLRHSRALALRATDPSAFRSILHRTTFAFTDPHFIVGPLEDSDPNVIPTSSDLVIELRDAAFVVADVRAGSAADASGIRPGWRLVSADGRAIEDGIEAIWDGVVLTRTPRQREYAATLVANGRRTGARSLVFEVDGMSRPVELANPRKLANEIAEAPPLTVETHGKIGIVRFNNSLGEHETIAAFDEAIVELKDTRGLVLDLRNTPSGGNTDVARAIIGHFVTEIRPYQVHEIPAVQRRTGVPRRFVEQVLPRAPHYPRRVAVLGGRWTGSMGEGLVIGMHAAAGARTFASDMGDLLGALHNFEMQHSTARVEFAVEALFHVDGTPREGFRADVVLPTADRHPDGGDPAMPAARSWLSG